MPTKLKPPKPGKPLKIKRGSSSLQIYHSLNTVNGKTYPQFTISYYVADKRIRKKYSSFEDARTEAEVILGKLQHAQHEVLRLTSKDRADYLHAIQKLKPLDVDLHTAITDYTHCCKLLPVGVTLHRAVEEFLQNRPIKTRSKNVGEIVDEFIKTKEQARRSEIHIRDMRNRLARFADVFQVPITSITHDQIQKYLQSLKLGVRTQRNHLRHIITLFRYAVRHEYLSPKALDEFQKIELPDDEITEIEIFSPEEMELVLANAKQEVIPWIVLGGFAGLRHAELQRLDWSEVKAEEGFVEIKARKSKTASRRLAPVTSNLHAWLSLYACKDGNVAIYQNMANEIQKLTKRINENRPRNMRKFKWRKNGLRHSFVSYRLAMINDAAKVALESGHSQQMLFRHYRQLVTKKQAEDWFSIFPTAVN